MYLFLTIVPKLLMKTEILDKYSHHFKLFLCPRNPVRDKLLFLSPGRNGCCVLLSLALFVLRSRLYFLGLEPLTKIINPSQPSNSAKI